jgi:hypothetical protein
MNYREARKVKVGDVVVDHCGARRRVVDINEEPGNKMLIFKLSNGSNCAHTVIKEIEAKDVVHNRYYQILAFNPIDRVDPVCQSHIYPSYVSCMSVKNHMAIPCCFDDICGQPIMLQSNPSDGLKFIDYYNAIKMLQIVQHKYPEKEFTIIETFALCFGRTAHRWVVSL